MRTDTLSEKVTWLRTLKGFTAEFLASKTGIGLARLQALEDGQAAQWDEVDKLAKALDVSTEVFRNSAEWAKLVSNLDLDSELTLRAPMPSSRGAPRAKRQSPWPPLPGSPAHVVLQRAADFATSPVSFEEAQELRTTLQTEPRDDGDGSFLLGLTCYWAGEHAEAAGHFKTALHQGTRYTNDARAFRDLAEGIAQARRQAERRQGQGAFRTALLRAYGRRCAISGWEGEGALEAAHIIPYSQTRSQKVQNGLLLRADLHTLFDLLLLRLWPEAPGRLTVVFDTSLRDSRYEKEYGNCQVRLPVKKQERPDWENLQRRWGFCPELPR